ncbi:TPA: hypothetical protein NJ909_000122 [Vibrio parahaemolyticus]|nr:hypothetical protein [Vibrio parahaemolyticus]
MINTIIKEETSFELGLLETEQMIEIEINGGALLLELFDSNAQKTVSIIEPKMPHHVFNIPYESNWKLIVKINGQPFTTTEFKLTLY